MITKATITIDDKVKKEASELVKEKQIRGGLSGLIEVLLTDFINKNNGVNAGTR